MIICICANVSDREIKRKASEGKSFEDIQNELGACCNCRICTKDIREIIKNEQREDCTNKTNN